MAALALAGRTLQPDRTSRPPAPVRPRNAGQPVSPVAGRAPPAVALLQRRHRDRFRAGPVPADGRPGLLLQRQQVSLPLHFARRRVGQAPSRHVLPPRPGSVRCLHRADPHSQPASRCTCASRSTTSASISPTAWRAGLAPAARTVRRQHPLRRGRPSRKSEFHGRLRRHVLPGSRGNPAARRISITSIYRERSYRADPFVDE